MITIFEKTCDFVIKYSKNNFIFNIYIIFIKNVDCIPNFY
jgi:hypothetical protein